VKSLVRRHLRKQPPEFPAPMPATLLTMPLADTFRIRLLASAMNKFLDASTATPWG